MKKLNKEQVFGLVRHILTFAAVFLVSKGVVEQSIVDEIIAGLIVIGTTVWSWVDKTDRKLSVWMIVVRQVLTVAGAFMLGFGVIKEGVWNEIVAMVMTLTAIVLSYFGNEEITEK